MKLLSHSGVGAPWPEEVNFEDKVEVDEAIVLYLYLYLMLYLKLRLLDLEKSTLRTGLMLRTQRRCRRSSGCSCLETPATGDVLCYPGPPGVGTCTRDNDTKGYQVKPTMLNIPEYPRARSSPNEKYLKVVMMT